MDREKSPRWRGRHRQHARRVRSPENERCFTSGTLQHDLLVVIHFNTMNLLTLTEIRRAMQNGAASARVHVQVESATPKLTREQQPYCELTLADACDRMTLRVWSDHPAYKACSALTNQDFIELTAEFYQSQYGLDARKWTVRPLTEQEKNELLQGPAELRAKQKADLEFISATMQSLADPRLRALCEAFLQEWGERFRRAAAARKYHHARRGGLVEHTAQMMRVAKAIAPAYPQLNLNLLLAGILFHDSGKLWENQFSETGFVMDYDEARRTRRSHFDWARDCEFALAKTQRRKRRCLENLLAVIGRRASASPASDRVASWPEGLGFTG